MWFRTYSPVPRGPEWRFGKSGVYQKFVCRLLLRWKGSFVLGSIIAWAWGTSGPLQGYAKKHLIYSTLTFDPLWTELLSVVLCSLGGPLSFTISLHSASLRVFKNNGWTFSVKCRFLPPAPASLSVCVCVCWGGAALCTTAMVQSYIVHLWPALCNTNLWYAPWCSRGSLPTFFMHRVWSTLDWAKMYCLVVDNVALYPQSGSQGTGKSRLTM